MTERLRALASVVVVGLVLGGCSGAVTTAPALADTSGGDPPDYVLEEDGTVVIDGDLATDCRSFAGGIPSADADPDLEQAQRVLEQCEEAGLLPSKSTTSSTSASSEVSAADGEGGGLPDTGGPVLVVPDKNLVIVRFGEDWGYNRWPELLRSIADSVPS